ncbi:MAG: hypothetical protein DRJ98_06935 [Thermoprotei archaeon]|nr:MAG: hypothetical protein DRJ98_06935 [Thermoprotei archaeon]RLF16973.1 MAG: hypothetical protein DRN06_04520 [Thermoprotei archaeon]
MSINLRYMSKKGVEKSVRAPIETYEYLLSNRGRWEVLIADEEKEVRAGLCHLVKIKPIELHPEEIVLPCPTNRHVLGSVISVGRSAGRVQRVEERRKFDVAIFAAVRDGTIYAGDNIGVLNVFPQATLISRVVPPPGFRSPPPPYR